MTIEQRIKHHQYLLVSKCLMNEAPVYLKSKIQYLSDRNPYSLRNVVSEKLQIPKVKTELVKTTFTYSGSKLWNELSVRQTSSHNSFKTKIKGLILNDDVPYITITCLLNLFVYTYYIVLLLVCNFSIV